MVEVSVVRFEALVTEALSNIPSELVRLIDNVAFFVEDRGDPADLLGLYDGVPLTERHDYGGFAFPDRIFIYRLATLDICETEADVIHEVGVTVVHEIAHHFGIDDHRLRELGWD